MRPALIKSLLHLYYSRRQQATIMVVDYKLGMSKALKFDIKPSPSSLMPSGGHGFKTSVYIF